MMISVYESSETNFNHNGLVVLSDCKTAFVEEELNGKYELELECPIDKRGKWQNLTEENIIKADSQLFRIYHKEKTLAGIKINARHIFYDLANNFLEDVTITGSGAGALNSVLSYTQYDHPFQGMSDIGGNLSTQYTRKNPVEAIMGDEGIIALWGGELVRDNFNIKLLQARGLDRGVLISYGKNIVGIDETLTMDSVCTRVFPVGKDNLTLSEKYLDSALVNNYPFPRIKTVDFSDCETEESLREMAQAYLDANDKPLLNYQVDFIELTKTVEYKNYSVLETVYLGDIVTIRHTKLEIDLKAKVIRIKKNALTNRIEEVELGSFRPSYNDGLVNPINDVKRQQAQDKTDLQKAIDNATLQINSALGGYVVKRNGELLIMDTEDPMTATKVWRWNQGGLGYSSTGYNGPYATAITADGSIVADFITTGTMNAALIKTGTITSKSGKLSINLDDEVLNIGGKIVYDSATETVSFAADVVLSWANIGDKPTIPTRADQVGARPYDWVPAYSDITGTKPPTNADNTSAFVGNKLTYIDAYGIYTGTLSADQINGKTISTITLTGALNAKDKVLVGTGTDALHTCHINTLTDGMRFQSHQPGSYLKIEDSGGISIYNNDTLIANISATGQYFGGGTSYTAKFA